MKVFVFPGQGSQKKGMGSDLFDTVPEYARWEPEIDALLGYSLRALCVDDAEGLLSQTQYTQPCLYTVNALHYLRHRMDTGEEPDALAGHSLGEFTALWVAGAYDFLDGLRLVHARGLLMSQAKGGGMAAVIGLSIPQIQEILETHGLTQLTVANRNSPTQFVLSGDLGEIEQAGPLMKAAGARLYSVLPVSAAFHSPHMGPAGDAFADRLATIEFSSLKRVVISNRTATPYPADGEADEMRLLLKEQMTHPVLWTDSIRYLMGQGATDFTEIGPGKVLNRLIRQIRKAG